VRGAGLELDREGRGLVEALSRPRPS
jgi:hypothetical protein